MGGVGQIRAGTIAHFKPARSLLPERIGGIGHPQAHHRAGVHEAHRARADTVHEAGQIRRRDGHIQRNRGWTETQARKFGGPKRRRHVVRPRQRIAVLIVAHISDGCVIGGVTHAERTAAVICFIMNTEIHHQRIRSVVSERERKGEGMPAGAAQEQIGHIDRGPPLCFPHRIRRVGGHRRMFEPDGQVAHEQTGRLQHVQLQMIQRARRTKQRGGIDDLCAAIHIGGVERIRGRSGVRADIRAGVDRLGLGEHMQRSRIIRHRVIPDIFRSHLHSHGPPGIDHGGHLVQRKTGHAQRLAIQHHQKAAATRVCRILLVHRMIRRVLIRIGVGIRFSERHKSVAVQIRVAGFGIHPGFVRLRIKPAHGRRPVIGPLVEPRVRIARPGGFVVLRRRGNQAIALVQVIQKTTAVALLHREENRTGQVLRQRPQIRVAQHFHIPQIQFDIPLAPAGSRPAVISQIHKKLIIRRQYGLQMNKHIADVAGRRRRLRVVCPVPIQIPRRVRVVASVYRRVKPIGNQRVDIGFRIAVFETQRAVDMRDIAPVANVIIRLVVPARNNHRITIRDMPIITNSPPAQRAGLLFFCFNGLLEIERDNRLQRHLVRSGRLPRKRNHRKRRQRFLHGHLRQIPRHKNISARMRPVGQWCIVHHKHPSVLERHFHRAVAPRTQLHAAAPSLHPKRRNLDLLRPILQHHRHHAPQRLLERRLRLRGQPFRERQPIFLGKRARRQQRHRATDRQADFPMIGKCTGKVSNDWKSALSAHPEFSNDWKNVQKSFQ